MGERATATRVLSRAAMLGLDSKLFDCQSLVLLTFAYFADNDRKGIERCMADFARLLERHENTNSPRILRFVEVSRTLQLIQQRQFSQAVEAVRTMANEINASSFDFEAACNLGSLLAVLATTSIDLSEGAVWVRALGMRYANTRGLCELMANACNIFPPYSESIRECLLEINKTAEKAMALSLSGDATGAVRSLLRHGAQTLNTKLVDLSQQVLLRHRDRIEEADALQQEIDVLRGRCGVAPTKAVLGQDSERHPGGVVIRTRARSADSDLAAQQRLRAERAGREQTSGGDSEQPPPDPADPLDKLRLRPN